MGAGVNHGYPWYLYPTLETNKQHANVIENGPLPLGMKEVERQML